MDSSFCIDCGRRKGNSASKRCYSCAAKDRVSKPGAKEAFSTSRKILWKSDDYINKLKQAKSTPEHKAKKSAASKRNWINGVYDNSPVLKISPLEDIVANALDELGVMYIRQFRPSGYSKVYDFLLPDELMLIEVDSYYWHHSDMMIKHGKAESDAEKDAWALEHGYSIARLDDDCVKSDQLVQLLQQTLGDR